MNPYRDAPSQNAGEPAPKTAHASWPDVLWLIVMTTAPFAVATNHGLTYAAILIGVIVMSVVARRVIRRLAK